MTKENELELIHKIKNGEYSYFEKLIIEYQNKLFSFLVRIIKNNEDALDICQDTFLKAYKNIKSFKEQSKFSTWLFQIGYFTAINHIKKTKNKIKYEEKYFKNQTQISLSENYEKNNINNIIKKILNEIDKKYQTILHLVYFEQNSYEEIACIMKIPVNTVKSYIFRGKNLIRQKLINDYQFEITD